MLVNLKCKFIQSFGRLLYSDSEHRYLNIVSKWSLKELLYSPFFSLSRNGFDGNINILKTEKL